jgi:DNA topoisomerase-1
VTLKPASETTKTKVFFPSEQGIKTVDSLDQYFSSIINVKYTANMESDLDKIADGSADEEKTLQDFWEKFTPLLDEAYEKMPKEEAEKVGEKCPECGSELVYRNGRFGKFISCSNFPKCRYTRQLDGKEKEKPVPTGKKCPECGGELLKRKSRFGTYFLGCSNFPKCHYMETLEGERIISKRDRAKAAVKAGAEAAPAGESVKKPVRKTVKKTAKKAAAKSTGKPARKKAKTAAAKVKAAKKAE